MNNKYNGIKDLIISAFILSVPRMFYRGLMLYFGWFWFITPFIGLKPLPFLAAVSISGIISLMTFEHIGEIHSSSLAFKRLIEWLVAASIPFFFIFLINLFVTNCNCRIYPI